MRIVVVSDSHGNKSGFEKLMTDEKFDYLFYLGDGMRDIGMYENLENIIQVSGNCDFFSVVPNERIIDLGGYKFFATHGNNYGVKYSLNSLRDRAEKEGVNFVLFGHTHRVTIEKFKNIYYINPGSFKKNMMGESCYIEILLRGGKIEINEKKI